MLKSKAKAKSHALKQGKRPAEIGSAALEPAFKANKGGAGALQCSCCKGLSSDKDHPTKNIQSHAWPLEFCPEPVILRFWRQIVNKKSEVPTPCSKTSVLCYCPCKQGLTWALYWSGAGAPDKPRGDACEGCFESWN
eukprot:5112301-Amphidinium_carterae.1